MTVKVCVGGTFNAIHDGHIALLTRAFLEGDEVFVGLTSDAMAVRGRSVPVRKYPDRLSTLKETLTGLSGGKPFHLFEISDESGPAATGDFDVIVVSVETLPAAERINRARAASGLKLLKVVVVAMVAGPDGKRISSSRVIKNLRGEDNP